MNHAGALILVAVGYWWLVFLSMHVIQPELSPVGAPGSAYVLGRYGGLMATTYFALAAAVVSARFGLKKNLAATTWTRVAGVMFLVAAVGAVMAGIFPMDFPPPPRTTSGRLHGIGGVLTFVPWVIGTLLYSLSARRDQRWFRCSGPLLALAVISVIAAVLLPLSIRIGVAGAVQRALLILLFTWLMVIAAQLMSGTSRASGSHVHRPQ
jgi:hypothetical protein